MSSKLDQALDDVIRDRKGERFGGRNNTNRRVNNNRNSNNNGLLSRRQDDNSSSSAIQKRLGRNNDRSTAIRSFVRTVNIKSNKDKNNSHWSHDLFDDRDEVSIKSRLGNLKTTSNGGRQGSSNSNTKIIIENLHYETSEKDLEELFSTVGDVIKANIDFDASGRSKGVGYVIYGTLEEAEKAIKRYDGISLDNQEMSIKISTPQSSESRGRSNNSRGDRSSYNNRRDYNSSKRTGERSSSNYNSNNSNSNRTRDSRPSKQSLTSEDLDKEMESYMKSNKSNDNMDEDTAMILD